MNAAASRSLAGLGLGAGLMFLLDPSRGNRRRALVADKVRYATRKLGDAAGATRRDLGNRLQGVRARVRARQRDEHVSDDVLCQRVRAVLGRVTSHPRAIEVSASDRRVTLSGDVLSSEIPAILRAVVAVPGVTAVRNEMTAHHSAEGIPSLQGGSERLGRWSSWIKGSWSPTAMLALGSTAAVALGLAIALREERA